MCYILNMTQLTTTILLAPSGSGKTTFIQKRQLAEAYLPKPQQSKHIDRDSITSQLLRDFRNNGGILRPDDQQQLNSIIAPERQIYRKQLLTALTNNTNDIIIDYPPTNSKDGDWAQEVITDSRQQGRHIILEGFTANPETTLARVLTRNSAGMANPEQELSMLDPSRKPFLSWLSTYRNMPDHFLRTAAIADEARLYDNNGTEPILIAEWQNGVCKILNQPAFDAFLHLREIDLASADFEARLTKSETINGVLQHTFANKVLQFYGPEAPASADNLSRLLHLRKS